MCRKNRGSQWQKRGTTCVRASVPPFLVLHTSGGGSQWSRPDEKTVAEQTETHGARRKGASWRRDPAGEGTDSPC